MLKEGVEYRIKISFRVRILIWKLKDWGTRLLQSQLGECLCPARGVCWRTGLFLHVGWPACMETSCSVPAPLSLQVNREIVSGLKYIQHTFRKGVKSKCFSCSVLL